MADDTTTDATTTARLAALEDQLLALLDERAQVLAQATAESDFDAYAHEKRTVAALATWRQTLGEDAGPLANALVALDRNVIAAQERAPAPTRDAGRAVVIGGGGRMGGWMSRFLLAGGWDVTVADPSGGIDGAAHLTDWHDAPLDAELIVVAAPLRPSNDILHELATLAPTGVVLDIGSLKSPLRTGLHALRDAGVSVTSVHPMFGPDAGQLHGRHVIFVDLGDAAANTLAEGLFEHTAARRVHMSLEEHDRVIAYILGLSHALNIAFVTAVAESGEAAPRLADLSSTTFDAQLGVAQRVVRENPHLYFEIQRMNDYGVEALAALSYAVEKVRSVVRAGDEAGFVRLMEQGHRYVQGR